MRNSLKRYENYVALNRVDELVRNVQINDWVSIIINKN